jgi:hypothetical protein
MESGLIALAWLLVVFLPLYGGLWLGIRNERMRLARVYVAIAESRKRPNYRRLRRP